jgi:RNA polymerase sigma-70 factor (ECF subfamily)
MTGYQTMVARSVQPQEEASARLRLAAGERPTVPPPRTDSIGKADRFHAAAVPHLDEVYTLARYLLRNPADAEDAAQECYLRAYRHFDTFRGGPIKPWLLAILRNVCRAEFARRSALSLVQSSEPEQSQIASDNLWGERVDSPESVALRQFDTATIQRLIAQLPEVFREVIVLREINDLSYREIADVVGAPMGTVMSRLARARTLLREAWIAEEGGLWHEL